MASKAPKNIRKRRTAPKCKPLYYRGIKIAPATGRPSELAKAFVEGFKEMYERPDGDFAKA